MRYLLHDVFINSVKKSPLNTAIISESGNRITYYDLNLLSNKFANLFLNQKKSVQEKPYVGIISSVQTTSIAAVLGILKIGGTYIPLDESSPIERLIHIVQNTKLDVIVIDSELFEKYQELFDNDNIKLVIIFGDKKMTTKSLKYIFFNEIKDISTLEPDIINQVSDDLAYILHSSGSTGIPKGIMLTHRNARTFVDWMQKEFKLTEKDIVMSRAPFKFDLSVFDIFNTFNAAATLVCYDWNRKRAEENKHTDYVLLMEKTKATILYTTPSTFISLMNRGNLAEAKLCLREVMYAGEPFPIPQLRKLQSIIPKTKIANIYGPTETNIITYYWINNLPKDQQSIPLGNVVDDTEILIVTDNKKIGKDNELGEIWCRGGTVTIGYLGMEEKTRESLVLSPFHQFPVYFWRTGDYGYRDKTGCLHYRGRKDQMIKVKGYRIEIGEVETAIATIEPIDEFVVVAVQDDKYGNRLYCYYSLLKDKQITKEEIISFLKNKLPDYMIPFEFIEMEQLPKTSSGKVDRLLLTQQTKKYRK